MVLTQYWLFTAGPSFVSRAILAIKHANTMPLGLVGWLGGMKGGGDGGGGGEREGENEGKDE